MQSRKTPNCQSRPRAGHRAGAGRQRSPVSHFAQGSDVQELVAAADRANGSRSIVFARTSCAAAPRGREMRHERRGWGVSAMPHCHVMRPVYSLARDGAWVGRVGKPRRAVSMALCRSGFWWLESLASRVQAQSCVMNMARKELCSTKPAHSSIGTRWHKIGDHTGRSRERVS